jgi:hypothetical protein
MDEGFVSKWCFLQYFLIFCALPVSFKLSASKALCPKWNRDAMETETSYLNSKCWIEHKKKRKKIEVAGGHT